MQPERPPGSARKDDQGKAGASKGKARETSGIENIPLEVLKEIASDELDDRLHLLEEEEEFLRLRQVWSWENLIEKASQQRYGLDCGVSPFVWRQAVRVLTPRELAVIYVLMERDRYRIVYPNAWLKALVKRKEAGTLNLDFAVFAARERAGKGGRDV